MTEREIEDICRGLWAVGARVAVEQGQAVIRVAKNSISQRTRRLILENREQVVAGLSHLEQSNVPNITRRRPGTTCIPLSHQQARLWFLDKLALVGSAYNIVNVLQIEGGLNLEALRQGLWTLTERHESLRTRFEERGGEPVQVIDEPGEFDLPLMDLSGLQSEERQREAQRLIHQERQRGFDLSAGPLFRAVVLRLAVQEHVLQLTLHHIISDGWSLGVMVRELSTLYRTFSLGLPSPLAPLAIQYADYVLWQRGWLQGEVLRRLVKHWTSRLAGAPPCLELPTDRVRPAVQSFKGGVVRFALSERLSKDLEILGRRTGTTRYMVLLAAFQVLLSRWSGQKDIVVGSSITGRTHRQTEGLIGLFVNTLVMRGNLLANPTFAELLEQVKQTALDAYAHQDIPFEKLVEELHPLRDLSRQPVFQVFLNFQYGPETLDLPGFRMGYPQMGEVTSKFDLSLEMTQTQADVQGRFSYATDLFDRQTIERLSGNFATLLTGIVANPDERVAALPLLSEAERERVLIEWNATAAPYPKERCIHELFAEQAARTPDAVAVVYEGQPLGYGELEGRANQVAQQLRGLGVGPDVIVGLCIERSLEMVIGLLGILKAGGAYLPLDPQYPIERLGFMLHNAQASVVLTQSELLARLPESAATVVCLDRDWVRTARYTETTVRSGVTPENLACVIYTAGSTGRPEGVMVSHGSVVNGLVWMNAACGIELSDRVHQQTELSFNGSVWEVFAPLLTGTGLVMAQRGGHEDGDCPAQLNHLYGPTEAAVSVSFWKCEVNVGTVQIGRPISNARLYVLDEWREPVAIGAIGELYIGGVGLARGYLHRPGLTAERFIANAFGEGDRLYGTGDRVRYLSDGNLEYLGRMVERRALPAPEGRPEVGAYVGPGTPTEEVLAGIWREILKVDRVGIHDNFFDLGGQSLLAIKAAFEIKERLKARVPIADLFEAPTLKDLAVHVESALALAALCPRPTTQARESDRSFGFI